MRDLAEIIQFSSLIHFSAVYALVSDELYLIHPDSGIIEASNQLPPLVAVDPMVGKSFIEIYQIDPVLGEEGVPFKLENKADVPINFQNISFTTVLVAGKFYKLAVVSKETLSAKYKAKEEAEKSALLNEVYHRVKNNLNIIVSLLSLQIKRITDPASRHKLIESKSRIFTLSLLQQNLYNSPRISEIKAGHYLHGLALSVMSTFKVPGKNVRLKANLEESWLKIDTLVPLGLIAHELISNAVLHAFQQQEEGEIELCFLCLSAGRFQLKIKDNGSGLPDERKPEAYDTLGFLLIQSLVKQLKANLSIRSERNSGSSFCIEFEEGKK